MLGFSRLTAPLRVAALAGALAAFAPTATQAATLLSETFDYTGNSPAFFSFSVPVTGTLTFTLSLPAPDDESVTGGFTAIITAPNFDSLFTVFDGEAYDPSTRDLGLASFPGSLFNDPAQPDDPHVLNGTIIWSAIAAPGDYTIDIFSSLIPSFAEFSPLITVEFDAAVAETPVPTALPLFASGLGALGLAAWRRRKASPRLQG